MSDLTKKGQSNQVVWSDAQEKAYSALKTELTSSPILRLPDNTKSCTLRTDASDTGLGAVLLQEHDGKLSPVSYASRKLTESEKYVQYDRERVPPGSLGRPKVPDIPLWNRVYIANRPSAFGLFEDCEVSQRQSYEMGDVLAKLWY